MIRSTRVSSQKRSSVAARPAFEALESRQLLSASPTLYADDTQGRLFTVVPATGAVHIIGQMPAVMADIAFASNGNLYGVDYLSGTSNLWKINPSNGSAVKIGSVGAFVNSLVFSSNGTLYAAGNALYKISTATGHGTKIGNGLSGFSSSGDLAFDNAGTFYLSTTSNDLVKVNASTGSATKVGAIGFSQVFGMAFGSDGVLYGLSNTTSQVFSINRSTGHGTALSSFANKGVKGVNGSSFPTEAVVQKSVVIYAADEIGDLYKVNALNGATSLIGKMATTMFDIAISPQGYIYGIDGHDNLYSINASNASIHYIGSLGVSDNVNSLTFAANGTLYAAGTHLYKLSTTTGHATNVGTIGYASAGDLVIDSKGRLLMSTTGNQLVQVNPYNGAGSLIGSLGFNQVLGMAVGSNGVLYGLSDSTGQIFTINQTTGQGSAPIHFSGGAIHGVFGAATVPTYNVAPPPPAGVTIYAADSTGNLFTVNSATGQTHVIGHMATVMYDIAFDKSGHLFGIDSHDGLWQINPTTAAISAIGTIGVNDSIVSLVAAPDGSLYAAGHDLYKIDVAQGIFYDQGKLGGYTAAGDLAFDKYGNLVMSTTSNQLVKINPNTAQTTLLGSIGFSQVLGLAEGSDGILYGMSDTSDQIFSVNPITGKGGTPVHFSGVNGVFGATVKP